MIFNGAQAPKVNTPVLKGQGQFANYWQYWLGELWRVVQPLLTGIRPIITLSADTTLTNAYSAGVLRTMLFTSGTSTFTLPDPANQAGRSYYFFKTDADGIIQTIAGTINGDPLGRNLTNQYDFAEITGNGTDWYVTENN